MDQNNYIIHASKNSIISVNPEEHIIKKSGLDPSSVVMLERELKTLNELNRINLNGNFPKVISTSLENDKLQIIMSRVGTHDINDIMNEISFSEIFSYFQKMYDDICIIHDCGFVHRDIKPGNFMCRYSDKNNSIEYAGIIDFGLSLPINRKQERALGGTKEYSHPSQMQKKFNNIRAHPGQDWFAFGRTMAHILVGGSAQSFKSSIDSGEIVELLDSLLSINTPSVLGNRLQNLITFTVKTKSETLESLVELESIATQERPFSECIFEGEFQKISFLKSEDKFQYNSKYPPKRHDILIMVDSTGSMLKEINDLKDNLKEVSEEVSKYLDIRVDLWAVGDYSRDENNIQNPVNILGKRLRTQPLNMAISKLDTDKKQIDDAEAYEAALQDAYLTDKWSPRKNTTRTIILVGDSYSHGWLTKNYWGEFHRNRKNNVILSNKKSNAYNSTELQELHNQFLKHHKIHYSEYQNETKSWSDARSERKTLDEFSKKGSVFVPSKKGNRNRPNILSSIHRCVNKKKVTVHSIFAGSNLVSRNFMKFVALYGRGTYTKISDGDLKIALQALFTIPDKDVFKNFTNKIGSQEDATQILDSITSFIIND